MLKQLLVNRRFQVFLLLAMLFSANYLQYGETNFLNPLRNLVFDTYNRILPRHPGNGVAIVDIDEDSLSRIGQWPWPHTVIGELTKDLRKMGARSVGFDIVFAEPDRTSPGNLARRLPVTPETGPIIESLETMQDNDEVFAKDIREAGHVCLGFAVSNQSRDISPWLKPPKYLVTGKGPGPKDFVQSETNFVAPMPGLVAAADGVGVFAARPDSDGIIRRIPLLVGHMNRRGQTYQVFPALSLETLLLGVGGKDAPYRINMSRAGKTSWGSETTFTGIRSLGVGAYNVPTDLSGYFYIYYAGHRPSLYIPAWKILNGTAPAQAIKDKIVLVGTSAIGLFDLRSSPIDRVVPGVEMHAEIIDQIMQQQFLKRPFMLQAQELLATALAGILIIFLMPYVSTGALALVSAIFIAGGFVGGLYCYQNYGLLIDPVLPTLIYLTLFILSSILTNMRSEAQKRAIRQAFSHYISPVLMEELAGNPEKLKLGGEVRELTVMFTDIRNFTTISESMDPADLIKMMNDFLTPMTSCVLENRGTIDKYMGDAMMAFWNAPLEDPDHAKNACRAALDMVKSLAPVNEAQKQAAEAAGRPFHELRAGIGLHSGKSSVGNMGSKQRFAYSALGDTVNLASRMESQTKGYGVNIMISEGTHKLAPDFAVIELDLLTVKGRSEPERVYALLGDAQMLEDAAFKDFRALHARMLETYRARKWDEAVETGKACEKLHPELGGLYALYRRRIEIYRENPPPDGWTGVWVATEK
ncbi:MAG: CHASE2 domain-containing protein [Alphaproteobacteria bacterium]|nr:CHASE2 domain-containing protein [Alphaproteobacteria bacterium]